MTDEVSLFEKNKKFSIEHILPQNYRPENIDDFKEWYQS